MKAWLVFVLALVLGIGLGLGLAYYQVHSAPWDGTGNGPLAATIAPSVRDQKAPDEPRATVIGSESFDFGTMDAAGKGSHDFEIKNTGKAKLTLTKGTTTCRCTSFEIEKTELKPGEATKVTVAWAAKNFRGTYRQIANLMTSDTNHPTVPLSVTGRILSSTKVDPPDLVFSDIPIGEATSQTLHVFSYVSVPFELSAAEALPPSVRQWFDVKIEPMPADQLKAEPDAKNGCLIRVTVKPGLPLGAFQQTIRLTTNLRDVPQIEIPVKGTMARDVTIIGLGWDNEHDTLYFHDVVESSEGAERRIFITARGDHRKKMNLKPVEVEPKFLQIDVDNPVEVPNKELVRVAVTVRIPKGSPSANYLGGEGGRMGRILFETGLPRTDKLEMRVRFAVQR